MSRACAESHPCVVNYEIDGKSSHCFPDLSFSFRVTNGFDALFPRYLRLSVQTYFQIFSQCPRNFIIVNQEKKDDRGYIFIFCYDDFSIVFYFRICHLITGTFHENMMPKSGRYYYSYEHILNNNTHNCDGHVNLVLHTAFQIYNVCISRAILCTGREVGSRLEWRSV